MSRRTLALLGGIVSVAILGTATLALTPAEWRTFETLMDVRAIIVESYVEDVDLALMDHGAVRGLIVRTDRHNALLEPGDDYPHVPPPEHSGRVGINFGVHDDGLAIVSVVPDSPAAKAGLASGDQMIGLQDIKTYETQVSVYEAQRLDWGRPGTVLKLNVFREGKDGDGRFRDIEIKYQVLNPLPAVEVHEVSPGVVWLRLYSLAEESVVAKIRAELAALTEREGLKQVILDLRAVSDGTIATGIAVADLFLPGGQFLGSLRSHQEEALDNFTSGEEAAFTQLPLVVFIDRGTAEAAEVAAAVLKQTGRAEVAGEKSFGKVTHLRTADLGESGRRILVLHATYYLPAKDAAPIHGHGVEPDLEVTAKPPVVAAAGETADQGSEEAIGNLLSILAESKKSAWERDQHLQDLLKKLGGAAEPAAVEEVAE
jgi:carboxyl-terminal processing protease